MAVMEACPTSLAEEEQPRYGGHLFHNTETGKSGCSSCGWSGIPTIAGGVISTRCPACEHAPDTLPRAFADLERELWGSASAPRVSSKVPRNQPCPCGSGIKAKRCGCEAYAT